MAKLQETITEKEIAYWFVKDTATISEELWVQLYEDFRRYFGEKFYIENETKAAWDLSLAAIAEGLISVDNLFQRDQAERIRKFVLEAVNVKKLGEYSLGEISGYEEARRSGVDLLGAIPGRLLERWLGARIKGFDVSGYIDPMLIMFTTEVLIKFSGRWKIIKEKINLISEDGGGSLETSNNNALGAKGFNNKPRLEGWRFFILYVGVFLIIFAMVMALLRIFG